MTFLDIYVGYAIRRSPDPPLPPFSFGENCPPPPPPPVFAIPGVAVVLPAGAGDPPVPPPPGPPAPGLLLL